MVIWGTISWCITGLERGQEDDQGWGIQERKLSPTSHKGSGGCRHATGCWVNEIIHQHYVQGHDGFTQIPCLTSLGGERTLMVTSVGTGMCVSLWEWWWGRTCFSPSDSFSFNIFNSAMPGGIFWVSTALPAVGEVAA